MAAQAPPQGQNQPRPVDPTPADIPEGERASDNGPPGWVAFAVVALMTLCTLGGVVVVAVLSGFDYF